MTRPRSRWRLLLAIGVAAFGSAAALRGQDSHPPAAFTAEQASAGRIDLQKNSFGACTDCHTSTLTGRTGAAGELPSVTSLPENYQALINGNGGRVPPLVGAEFMTRWAARSTKDLTAEFQKRFSPPAGYLSEETRLNMIAYMLQASGATPGRQPLTMATDVAIRALTAGPPTP